jgi:hypothetical protein
MEQYPCTLVFYISSCVLTVPLIKVCSFMCFKGGSINLFDVFGSNSILLSWTDRSLRAYNLEITV